MESFDELFERKIQQYLKDHLAIEMSVDTAHTYTGGTESTFQVRLLLAGEEIDSEQEVLRLED